MVNVNWHYTKIEGRMFFIIFIKTFQPFVWLLFLMDVNDYKSIA